jgi:hypothetical protein
MKRRGLFAGALFSGALFFGALFGPNLIELPDYHPPPSVYSGRMRPLAHAIRAAAWARERERATASGKTSLDVARIVALDDEFLLLYF